jgi:quercetin dioxygenase-like cupin family protein
MKTIVEKGPRITENLGDFLGQMHHFSDGLYAKQVKIPANHVVGQHAHKYSHLSVLAQGKVLVEVDGQQFEYTAPACIEIKANKIHRVFAYTDAVWFCIHATSETDVDAIDQVLVSEGA